MELGIVIHDKGNYAVANGEHERRVILLPHKYRVASAVGMKLPMFIREPKPPLTTGDRVLYKAGADGTALYWLLYDQYKRVMDVCKTGFDKLKLIEVSYDEVLSREIPLLLWQGSNLAHLLQDFPANKYPTGSRNGVERYIVGVRGNESVRLDVDPRLGYVGQD